MAVPKATVPVPRSLPHPPRLKLSMSERMPKWWMIMADREGVGPNREQLTTAGGWGGGVGVGRKGG